MRDTRILPYGRRMGVISNTPPILTRWPTSLPRCRPRSWRRMQSALFPKSTGAFPICAPFTQAFSSRSAWRNLFEGKYYDVAADVALMIRWLRWQASICNLSKISFIFIIGPLRSMTISCERKDKGASPSIF